MSLFETPGFWQRLAYDYVIKDREQPPAFARHLVLHGGRRAARALIRARQRYEKLHPPAARRLHAAYARRRAW